MKTLIVAGMMMIASTASAQQINLACQGPVVINSKHSKFPKLDKKNERDFVYFNVNIDASGKSITIGDSYHTGLLKYPNLVISESWYNVDHFWNRPNPDYAYYSMGMFVNRFTGEFRYNYSSLTSDGSASLETKIQGTCQLGVHWQPKF